MQRRTRLGILLIAAGAFCFPLGLAFRTLAPAFLGVVLISLALTARVPLPIVAAERTLPHRAYTGESFEVVTTAQGPAGAPLFIDAPTALGARLVSSDLIPGRGSARLVQRFTAASPGTLTWLPVSVRVQDTWGVVEDVVTVPLLDHLQVIPSAGALAEGRKLGRRALFKRRSKSIIAADEEPEVERLREGQPGDRLRDIDWAHTSKLGRIIVRQMTNEPLRPVVVLMDATSSMRLHRRESKLATAVAAALTVATAAHVTGIRVGLVAWSERGVEAQVRVAGSRHVLTTTMARLGGLPSAGTEDAQKSAREVPPGALTHVERSFLEAAATFSPHARGAATPLESALAAISKASPQPSLVIAFLDVEENPNLAEIVTRRLRLRGHQSVVVGLATGAHHHSLADVDSDLVERLVAWRVNRERARGACVHGRVPFHILGPKTTTKHLAEVVKSAR